MKEFAKAVMNFQEPITQALQNIILTMPKSVQKIAEYTLLFGGKRLRPCLTLIWYNLLKGKTSITHPTLSIYDSSIVLEMFHVASLLHDDVLDDADLRRGKQSAHLKFGIRPCLLAGDALLATGNKLMAKFQNVALMNVISDALLKTANGEIEEIELAGKVPNHEQEYLSVIEGKTAWIIRSACLVGAIMAGASKEEQEKAANYGLNLGMAFQIVDDALDFSDENIIGKSAGGDLRERKCTPPIFMYLQALTEEEQQKFTEKFSILPSPIFEQQMLESQEQKENGFTEQELAEITQKIIQAKYPEKTRELANKYLQKAEESLHDFQGHYKELLLEALEYVRSRNK